VDIIFRTVPKKEDKMADLTTRYMGLELRNPIIAGSSGLTDSVEKIKQLEKSGAGAVVLKSIFEEQIMMEARSMKTESMPHTEEADYIAQYTRSHNLNRYLKLIKEARNSVEIPVIASINCVSNDQWIDFSRQIEDAGAAALELNLFVMPGDPRQTGEEIESTYFSIVKAIREKINIPLAVKIGYYFSGLANFVFNLSVRGVKAIVLFNRFYRPDIDLEKETMVSAGVFSDPAEISLPLRWVGMLSDEAKCDLAASTGVHDGHGVAKCLLAGARAVHIASCLYRHGPEHIASMIKELEQWMQTHNYGRITDFLGKLSYRTIQDPVLYERSQFMKYFSNAKT
jgi:dihydroorotate dehydrogenase (fumarate)